ncbi:hypothetical protein SK128_027302 [Halocaridina rubra]|uniref:AMP-dependent synthetase/ligase domain-containing protein n=1 Tax=Halocaridina rubra TaxID=373956 RepID=A0AAN9A6I9_HALRR
MSDSNSIIQDMNGGRVLKYEGTLPLPSLPDRNYASLMLEIFAQHGRKIAVVDTVTGETFSYEDLRRVALSTQRGLINAGVRKGDAVIILTETYSCYHAALLGVMLSGVVAVSCRADLMKEDLVHRIRVTRAKWVITAECAERNVEAAFRELGSDHLKKMWVIGKASGKDLFFGEAKNSDKPMAVDNNFDAATTCALIYFSSGTTGLPKGVKLSHKNLTAYYYMYRYLEDIEEIPERSFCGIVTLIPFCPVSTYGYTICMKAFSKGHKVVILENFIPGEYLRAIEKYKAAVGCKSIYTLAYDLMLQLNSLPALRHSPIFVERSDTEALNFPLPGATKAFKKAWVYETLAGFNLKGNFWKTKIETNDK